MKRILRHAYQSPQFIAENVKLVVELDSVCKIQSVVNYRRLDDHAGDLILNGVRKPANMHVERVQVNGEIISPLINDTTMKIPAECLKSNNIVEIDVTVDPSKNLSLSGLYLSNGNFCTQCEAEGFRNFMYFLDRPDVMAKYSTKIIAHKASYPILLGNGNLTSQGDMPGGKHFAIWDDPWPKPCYLFALVAGNLQVHRDYFETASKNRVEIGVYVEKGNTDKTTHAMDSIKKAFKWDEERFGFEYDLKHYNLVAVSDFNMGAMENKGLNIFNSKYVLAKKTTATDEDYKAIESVIGHEIFHNITGNRVTCRDWFQLTLKEGLTVFRDQEFTSDVRSRAEKRIDDVRTLRAAQFAEDAGPMAHPIRPDSYVAIDNFYTPTVYEKGAEVIRMMYTIVGKDGFREGLQTYLKKCDGTAATCEDFISSIEEANPGTDLSKFLSTWYAQSGTPVLEVSYSYDASKREMHVSTNNPREFDIPCLTGLVGENEPVPVKLKPDADGEDTALLRVDQKRQEFTFYDVPEGTVPSFLRQYSAPVILKCPDYKSEDLAFLATHDTDSFNRYDAGQELARRLMIAQIHTGKPSADEQLLVRALSYNLNRQSLSLPDEWMLTQMLENGTVEAPRVHATCDYFKKLISESLLSVFEETYDEHKGSGTYNGRCIKNICLQYLAYSQDDKYYDIACRQVLESNNMTDRMGGLVALNGTASPQREEAMQGFYKLFESDRLVVQKWLRLEALQRDALPRVQEISQMEKRFDIRNPNDVRALFGALTQNYQTMHKDSQARTFLMEKILEIDTFNPHMSSRLCKMLLGFEKYTNSQDIKKSILSHVRDVTLSPDLGEIIQAAENCK